MKRFFPSARSLGVIFLAGAVSCAEPPPQNSEAALTNPTSSGLPSSMSQMVIEGNSGSGGIDEGCHAVLITRTIALTAAHCFEDFHPQLPGVIEVFNQTISLSNNWNDVVRFHPNAWGGPPVLPWTTPQHGANGSSDLAVVFLPAPASSSFTVAKLWNPLYASGVNFLGATVTIGGHTPQNGELGPTVTGVQVLNGLVPLGGGFVLEGQSQPSALQGGDSGGGAFLNPAVEFGSAAAASSGPLSTACAEAQGGATSETVLVGIASSASTTDWWAPTFTHQNLSWIGAITAHDIDNDGWCDDEDNCASDANPGQENCNAVAESDSSWGSSGVELGDVCDPVPCARPELAESAFAGTGVIVPWHADGTVFCWAELGRSIRDKLFRLPVREVGAAAVSTTTASVYFCDCRDSSGAPSTDPQLCAAPPNNCRFDPAELAKPEGGGSDSPTTHTFWHEITLTTSGGSPAPQPTPMTYVDGGSAALHLWDYVTDHASWEAQGWVPAGTTSPSHGPGTDLGGVFWLRDTTTVGASAHGCSGCSLADNFTHGLAPDPESEQVHCKKLPRYKPAPWWTYCAVCGDGLLSPLDEVQNPVVTFATDPLRAVRWAVGGATDVTDAFDDELALALTDPSLTFAAPSEPIDVAGYRGAPRAIAIDLSRGLVRGEVIRGDRGFELFEHDVALGELDQRQGVAATFSLRSQQLFVVTGSQLIVVRLGGRDVVTIELETALESVTGAVVVGGQLWVLGNVEGRFQLYRVDIEDGALTSQQLDELSDADEAWLRVAAGGTVIVTSSGSRGHAVWRAAVGRTVSLEAIGAGDEALATAPSISGETLTLPLAVRGSARGLRIEPARIDQIETTKGSLK